MSTLSSRLEAIRATLPESGVSLVAVSKFHPAEAIAEAYAAGQRIFGESRAQEVREKHAQLPKDIEWHFIGHLQPNKVKYIAHFVSLIHAVDSLKLLREIDRQAARCGRVIPCLLQLHVAQEETKFGFTPEECLSLLDDGEWRTLKHVQICGLMCMASNVDDEVQIRNEFRRANTLFAEIKERHFAADESFRIRSWGMSDDYSLAIAEGSTMVRIGSKIFGERI